MLNCFRKKPAVKRLKPTNAGEKIFNRLCYVIETFRQVGTLEIKKVVLQSFLKTLSSKMPNQKYVSGNLIYKEKNFLQKYNIRYNYL